MRYVFFGLPEKLAASCYLYDLTDQAFAVETASFHTGATYAEQSARSRRTGAVAMSVELA